MGFLMTIVFSPMIIVSWLDCCWLLINFFGEFILLIQKDSIRLISFFNLLELFANNVRSLLNDLFGVKIFNYFSSSTSSSLSSDGMSNKSSDSSLSVDSLSFSDDVLQSYPLRNKFLGSYLDSVYFLLSSDNS